MNRGEPSSRTGLVSPARAERARRVCTQRSDDDERLAMIDRSPAKPVVPDTAAANRAAFHGRVCELVAADPHWPVMR